jgi:hypothetical protein
MCYLKGVIEASPVISVFVRGVFGAVFGAVFGGVFACWGENIVLSWLGGEGAYSVMCAEVGVCPAVE